MSRAGFGNLVVGRSARGRWRALRRSAVLQLALLVLCASCPAATPRTVIYIRPTADIDRERSYPVELLQLSLARSGLAVTLEPSFEPIPQARAIRLLSEGRELDVLWTVTSPERERVLRPVRIPIDRGIYGWRLFLIKADDQARFDALAGPGALAQLEAGQGHDWPDVAILRYSGFRVGTGSSYDGLFEMLARGRIDYFPRAVPEVWAELQQRRQLPLAVETSIVLHYPSAMFFFVGPDDIELAQALERGLERAAADGSFAALFDQYFGDGIRRARLDQRRVFAIENPLLPTLRESIAPAWWFTP